MRAIVATEPGRFELLEIARPEPGPGMVLIRTLACGICATDLDVSARPGRIRFPAVLGHEWSGVIAAVGAGVDDRLVGTRCVGENVLSDGGEVGFEHPGGYGEYFVTEAGRICTLDDTCPAHAAAMVEPLAVCVHATHRLAPRSEGPVLILGDGPIGLLMTLLLSRSDRGEPANHPVVVAGGREVRLELARAWGASSTLDYRRLGDRLFSACRREVPDGYAIVVEATGRADVADEAVALAREKAQLLILGDYDDGRAGFPWNTVLHRELSVIGSNASAGAWGEAVRIASTWADPGRLVTHRVRVDRYLDGLALVRTHDPHVVKVVIDWQDSGPEPGYTRPDRPAGGSDQRSR